jgi:hypothetical protein
MALIKLHQIDFNQTGSYTGSLQGTASYALTASFALNAGTTVNTGSFITTSSFNNFTSSYNTGSFTGSFTGVLLGTSSYSNQSLSSSYALTASFALNGGGTTVNTGSFVTTSSFNSFTSSFNNFTSSYNTGSFTGSFTGSLLGTSSLAANSISSSYALTASFALNAGTTINTGSFITTSSFNTFTASINAFTSSYNTGSFTGSFTGVLSGTSSYSNQSLSSSYALTASFALNAGTTVNTGSFVTTSSFNNLTSSFNNFTSSYNTGSFTGSFTGSGLSIVNAQIGDPTDGSYSDGFFDTFNSSTKLSDALDEISAAFLDLAPAKAPVLTNTTMSRVNPAVFTGNLAGGLNPQWYVTASAYSQYTTITSGTTVDLRATGSRAGKASNISASLIGGVTSSRAYGTAAFTTVDSRSLSNGLGSSGTIDIDFLGVFNTFWAVFSASIDDTITQTGSVQYIISADNSAGQTNPFQLFYVGGLGDYPNQSTTVPTCQTSSTTFNYLSGITMLRTSTFTINFTGSNLFNPVYNLNQVTLTSSFFTTLTTGSNTPQWDDTLRLSVTRSLLPTTHSGQLLSSGSITVSKPGKSNVGTSYGLSNSYINSYTASVSTNNTNAQTESFLDEARRYTNLNTSTWASSSILIDGNLQVQNTRLIVGRWGDYGSFVSGSTSAATTYANYFRDSIPGTTNRIGGNFSIIRNTNAFAASTPISAWDSGGRLEAVLVLKSDITGPQTSNVYYDLGRAVGSDLGTIKGIRNSITTNTTTTYTVTWALPSGINTGTNGCVIWVRYRNTPNTDFITSLTITYN